ncbi:DUF4082 domain-containing protein [Longimicrobium sp.]|uniref:DUF4082 domain-containing protein n=1 Tax=Longimicrobium sp. TaxID=2029185 RepID=UPI002C4CAE6B|nr:DUF4082 domain-containing protein [Longimicrobium sp.]HSU14744.1 DUF4082 domain-containing protein [Longimicrobium sp.]
MKRWIFAAVAALSVAACADGGLVDTRTPIGPRDYIVWLPTDSIYETLTPADVFDTNGTGAWEVGTLFTTDDTVLVTGFRFYKGAGETGSHTANLWTSTGTKLVSKPFTSETASGWQKVSLATTYQIPPGTYMVSFNTNVKQGKTGGYFAFNGPIYRTHLTAIGGGYVQGAGLFPSSGSTSAFFADLTYRAKLCNTINEQPCP